MLWRGAARGGASLRRDAPLDGRVSLNHGVIVNMFLNVASDKVYVERNVHVFWLLLEAASCLPTAVHLVAHALDFILTLKALLSEMACNCCIITCEIAV